MKMLNSPLCKYCNLLETLPHMLVECNIVHDQSGSKLLAGGTLKVVASTL